MRKLLTCLVCVCCLCAVGCAGDVPTVQRPTATATDAVAFDADSVIDKVLAHAAQFDTASQQLLNRDCLIWFFEQFGQGALEQLAEQSTATFTSEDWYTLCGNTVHVLLDRYTGALDPDSEHYRADIRVIDTDSDTTILRMVGDVSFADNWKIAPQLDARGKGIYGVLSEATVEVLRGADILLLNNEFTYSNRGTPLKGKLYTFRADPARATLLHDIGADIVSLANNHAYDFGADAFADTLATLQAEQIPYIGAGANREEAARPFYFIVGGRKYAFTAATKAEKYVLTPEAQEDSSGVMRTYDPTAYLQTIAEAAAQSDYTVAYVHWGKENSHTIEDGLYELGGRFIDAGADIVVGSHAHVLQGIQFYKDKPIVYNLGNFIFNAKTLDTGILEIRIQGGATPTYRFLPAVQQDCYTQLVDGDEKARILEFMQSISIDVQFDEDGSFTQQMEL